MNRIYTTREICHIALAVALIAVCSWIAIPASTTISFTLQTFAVFCAVGFLGTKCAVTAVGVYILLGAVGAPVFAGFNRGISYLLGSTGGYIIGFLFTALVSGLLIGALGRKLWALLLAMAAGLLVCYFFGTVWFYFVYAAKNGAVGILTVLGWCVFPYLPFDALKIALAAFAVNRLARFVRLH